MKNSNRPGSLYKRCLLLLLACSILLLPLVSAHAETCPTANATVHGVNGFGNMRALADTESAKVATLSNGARVYAKPAVKGWYFVEVGSVKGYRAD